MYSNYDMGFAGGLTVRGVPLVQSHPGMVFWVGNSTASTASLRGEKGASDGNKGTFLEPFSTLDYAVGQCVADRGDIIFVRPGHVTTVSAAGGLTLDVAGVAVVGLGVGSKRAKIQWTTVAGATVVVSAANVSLVNMTLESAIDDVTIGIDVSAVAGFTMSGCSMVQSAADKNFVDAVDFATGASDIVIENSKFIGADASNDAFLNLVAADGLYIANSYFASNVAQTAAHGLIAASGAVTNIVIKDSHFRSNIDGAIFIALADAANGGLVSNCYFSSLDVAGAITTGFDLTGAHMFECYVAGEPDTWGIIGGGAAYANG